MTEVKIIVTVEVPDAVGWEAGTDALIAGIEAITTDLGGTITDMETK